ncbi:DUF6412 domain-containing protein [Couchioplanes caeruleus]|uniref:DUF6412 domain-containing protein n=1 Tax=Couchioplanes caeruleus TaxID=56438 RepID=UPI0020C0DAD8|nr:DUF6412 domain-containing protein [Couchioplanes caeruleus]UQU66001.1 DUF6412 domain-containing protein [Couchioplanes caeruleus]
MLLLGLWAVVALPGAGTQSSHLVLGLAAVAAGLLMALVAAGVPAPARPCGPGSVAAPSRSSARPAPRFLDPDAPGRPRPRAPSAYPAAALA